MSLEVLFCGGVNYLGIRIGGVDGESAGRCAFNVKGELVLSAVESEFEIGKLGGEIGDDLLLNCLQQLLARGSFEWWNRRIAGASDEASVGLLLDVVGELRDQALEIHWADSILTGSGDLDY